MRRTLSDKVFGRVWRSLVLASCALAFGCVEHRVEYAVLPEPAPGFVAVDGGRFVIDGEEWFPKMLNYKAFMRRQGDTVAVVPASWYSGSDIRGHFDTIAAWGFNAVRICLDAVDEGMDTSFMYRATRAVIAQASAAGLRVMLLVKPPFDGWWRDYTVGLMKYLADMPALWAYDLMNEPLYFDPAPKRDKDDALSLVAGWRDMVRTYAPHQLFTIGFAEPIETFEWDPALLPVDFVEFHTYHPLRVASEIYWYSRYVNKPWMIGETGLPADNDSVPYSWQASFMRDCFDYAVRCGAAGFGWWEFQDCPEGVNFEAQYTGLRNSAGEEKPAARIMTELSPARGAEASVPDNYYNMLGYRNLVVRGCVVDDDGKPIEGAVIRGWNDDWSVGMNTISDAGGRFTLVSNDYCVHFEVSAPRCSKVKFNRNVKYKPRPETLPQRSLEYQSIDYRPFLASDSSMLRFRKDMFVTPSSEADLGRVRLRRL